MVRFKFLLFFLIIPLLFNSCAEEIITAEQVNSQNHKLGLFPPCTSAGAIEELGNFVLGTSSAMAYYDFKWTNSLFMLDCEHFDAQIEFFNDNMTDPNTMETYSDGHPFGGGYCSRGDVDTHLDIDFINTTSFQLPIANDVFDSKCFWWRIVLTGSDCASSSGKCITETPWHFLEAS